MQEGVAEVQAEGRREEQDRRALEEGEQVLQDAEVYAHVVDPEVAEAVDELASDQESDRVSVQPE